MTADRLTNTMRHTPGPWTVAHANDKGTYDVGIHGPEPDGYIIADLCDDGYPEDVQRENARLIAAAPELLEAARNLAELLRLDDEGHSARYDRIAETYFRETGHFAPGKDVAAAADDGRSMEERHERFDAWYAQRVAKARAAVAKATEAA